MSKKLKKMLNIYAEQMERGNNAVNQYVRDSIYAIILDKIKKIDMKNEEEKYYTLQNLTAMLNRAVEIKFNSFNQEEAFKFLKQKVN